MKLWIVLACLLPGLSGCGGVKQEPEPEEQLDPYRSLMSTRINAVLYAKNSPEKILAELALLGVAPGKSFDDFKEESGIDDWFADEGELGERRYTSLTCGLSPVVGEDGTITRLFRNKKWIEDKLYPELALTSP